MKKSYLVLCIIIGILLTGCDLHLPSHNLVVCGSYGVPGMLCRNLKGGTYKCEILGTDSYGRTMFAYTTTSDITGEEETAIVICQVSDLKQYVYYYEDLCYLWGEISDDGIALLKEQNDWECELDYTKMTKRENEVSFDLVLITRDMLDSSDIEGKICEEFDVERENIEEVCFLDISSRQQELLWVELEKDDTLKKFFMIVDAEYQLWSIEVEDEMDLSVVSNFKQDSGWAYEYVE